MANPHRSREKKAQTIHRFEFPIDFSHCQYLSQRFIFQITKSQHEQLLIICRRGKKMNAISSRWTYYSHKFTGKYRISHGTLITLSQKKDFFPSFYGYLAQFSALITHHKQHQDTHNKEYCSTHSQRSICILIRSKFRQLQKIHKICSRF